MVGRHLQVGISVTNRFDQAAFPRIAGHQGRSGFTAFEKAGARIEPKLSLSFLALDAMALVAMLDQNWADLRLEEVHRLPFARSGQAWRSQRGEARQQQGTKETAGLHFCSLGRREDDGRFNAAPAPPVFPVFGGAPEMPRVAEPFSALEAP